MIYVEILVGGVLILSARIQDSAKINVSKARTADHAGVVIDFATLLAPLLQPNSGAILQKRKKLIKCDFDFV